MKYFSEVIKIIDGALRGDTKKVADYSLLLATKLEGDGEKNKSDRIRNVVNKQGASISTSSFLPTSNVKQIPFDQESKLELANIILPSQIEDKKIILSEENEKQIEKFILSYENTDKLASFNLDIPTTMILYGPPGCGKTETALRIAKRLNLPIIIARLDSLISSYLGSTAKNIRLLFDYVERTPCILFLDEFDALAKQRDDMHEMGELKRVVNSLLQNVDSLGNKSILIAATNHEKLLDTAIWRRFSTRLNIDLPNYNLIHRYLENILSDTKFTLDTRGIDFLSDLFKGLSIADIQQIAKTTFRKCIIDEHELELADFVESYFFYMQLQLEVPGDLDLSRRNKVKYLLSINSELSNRFLGEILRCHHNTIKSDKDKINKGAILDER